MRDFFLAPILSLFSLNFYRRLLRLPRTLGFLYLAYLSLLLSILGVFSFRVQFLPIANELAGWLAENLPEMIVTQQGVQMKTREPLLLAHPRWGPLLYLDPKSDYPNPADLERALVVLTRTKAAYRDPAGGEIRIQDLIPPQRQERWRDLVITGPQIRRVWRQVTPWVSVILFILLFIGIYLWKLVAGFAYSLVGLLLNRFRTERLSYFFVLNLAFFALTPVIVLQVLVWQFPRWPIPLNLLTATLVTSLYLAVGILGTQHSRSDDIIKEYP